MHVLTHVATGYSAISLRLDQCCMLLQVSVSQVACTALSMIGVGCGNLTSGYTHPLPGLTARSSD